MRAEATAVCLLGQLASYCKYFSAGPQTVPSSAVKEESTSKPAQMPVVNPLL